MERTLAPRLSVRQALLPPGADRTTNGDNQRTPLVRMHRTCATNWGSASSGTQVSVKSETELTHLSRGVSGGRHGIETQDSGGWMLKPR
jgi:hypothetical protein